MELIKAKKFAYKKISQKILSFIKEAFYARCHTDTQILFNNSNNLHLKKKKFNCENNVRLNGQYLRDQKVNFKLIFN